MKLLVPLDRSPRDGMIVPYATTFARRLRARLVFVHSVPEIRSFLPGSLRHAQAYMDAVAESVRKEGLRADSFLGRGDPPPQILQLAVDLPADMIIMATRGARGVGKLMFGSVADAIVSFSPVPVLLLTEEMVAATSLVEKGEAAPKAA